MGLFNRMAAPQLRADVSWNALDDRWYSEVSSWASTFAGFGVTPDMAMRVSAVFACNSLIAETLGSLPCQLMRRLPQGGSEKATDHRLYRTLKTVAWRARQLTPMDYFTGGQMNLGMRGRALSKIEDDGDAIDLIPLHPAHVTIEELSNGALRYVHHAPGRERETLRQEQVLDVRDITTDGFTAAARATLAREAIAVAAAAEAFVGGFFKNDATGRLLIKHPGSLSPEKRAEFRAMIQENYAGSRNASKAMLLTHGVEASELSKPDGGKFIVDPRNFQVADVARFWRVPAFMLGIPGPTAWGGGLEEQMQGFVDFTEKPWADRWTQAMALALLDEEEQDELYIEFNFRDLVRGNLLTRYQAYAIAKNIGALSPNEIRGFEHMGPREGGEKYQENTSGAAPSAGAPDRRQIPRAPAPTPEPEDDDEEQAVVPGPLLMDAAQRIARADVEAVTRRAAKADGDPDKWRAWLEKHTQHQRDYATQVLAPLAAAYGVPVGRMAATVTDIAGSGFHALARGVPEGWAGNRASEVAGILDLTFCAAQAA